jgi:hypothetical protein
MVRTSDNMGKKFFGVISVLLPIVAATACITLLYLGMRAVIAVGGHCVDGPSAYAVAVRCPKGVGALMPISIVGVLIPAGVYAWRADAEGAPNLVLWLWTGLFGALGYNFLAMLPGVTGILLGAMFWVTAIVPFAAKLFTKGGLLRTFAKGKGKPSPPPKSARETSAALEELKLLHARGVISDETYSRAKEDALRKE